MLSESIASGETPFFVNATAGTTVLGAFDPIVPIATICKPFKVWLHVDASWGGALVFSAKQEKRALLGGIALADSITFNPHKMLGVPLLCSLLMTKNPDALQVCSVPFAIHFLR
jgi:glutamate/tyrosine decarboxylase-like PLP-dependent enzyme